MHNPADYEAEPKNVDPGVVAGLPKVVLNDRIDGGLRPATLVELAAEAGHELPTPDPRELAAWFVAASGSGSAKQYRAAFDHVAAVLQTAENITRATREAVEDLADDNVVYAELRIAPELHVRGGLSMQDVVDAAVEGCRLGERAAADAGHDITVRLLLAAMCQSDPDLVEEVADLVADNVPENADHPYVVGFDLAGEEDGCSSFRHHQAFERLRRKLVRSTVNAGESSGPESIREAVIEGANRLGQATRIYEDFTASIDGIELQFLSGYVRDQRIPLEVCISANVACGAVEDIADHPFPLLDDLGFTCTVNTGARLLCGTSMTRELMLLVDNFDYGYTELFQLTCNAIENAFVDLPTRERILDTLIYPDYLELTDRDNDGEVDPDDVMEMTLN
ncbi:adenosine deaminase [Corynebacterium sp. 335C]